MSLFSKGVMNVLGDECPGDECRTIGCEMLPSCCSDLERVLQHWCWAE